MVWWFAGCGSPVPATGPVPQSLAERAAGTWTGTLDAGGARIRLVFHLDLGEGGALTGTMDSPDQGATGIPIDAVAASAEGLELHVGRIGGTYEGTWTQADALHGTWSQGPAKLPLDLARGEAAAPPARPQDPVPPLPYTEREIRVEVEPGVVLAGTLTVPPTDGPHPAVVLVTGSGPHDRDESLMGHRPFRVLADALTRASIAVLRCDDRGVGASTGSFAAATTLDFGRDAAAAVRHLRGIEGIDPDRVGILGHSEGGYAALLAAGEVPVAFVVLMAGPGLTGRAVIESQVEAAVLASGQPPEAAAAARASQSQILAAIAEGGGEAELRAAMAALGLPVAQIQQSIPVMTSPWYRTFVRHDPAPSLRALTAPVLALIGERDTQVVPGENGEALRAALASNPDATVRILPGLNHLLQPARTGLLDEYAAIETTIDPSALDEITRWVKAHTAR